MTAMAKVRLLAVLTMDGCPAETTSLCGQWLGSDKYGIGALKEDAICILKEDTSLTLLSNRTEQTDDSLNYLIEATEKTAGIINGMMRMRLVDDHPLPASRHSGKRQQAVSGLTARKRMDMHGEQTVERQHNTDNLWSENTPPAGGCVQEMNIFKSFRRSKCEHTFKF